MHNPHPSPFEASQSRPLGSASALALIYLALSMAFSALFKLIYRAALNYPDRR